WSLLGWSVRRMARRRTTQAPLRPAPQPGSPPASRAGRGQRVPARLAQTAYSPTLVVEAVASSRPPLSVLCRVRHEIVIYAWAPVQRRAGASLGHHNWILLANCSSLAVLVTPQPRVPQSVSGGCESVAWRSARPPTARG